MDIEFLRMFFSNLGFTEDQIEEQIKNYIKFKKSGDLFDKNFVKYYTLLAKKEINTLDHHEEKEFSILEKKIEEIRNINRKRVKMYSKFAKEKQRIKLRTIIRELGFNSIQDFLIWSTNSYNQISIYPIMEGEVCFDLNGLNFEIPSELIEYIKEASKFIKNQE